MEIIQKPAAPGNYGAPRSLSVIRYIVLHYTGNDGDSAPNNGAYFARNERQTSAHYFVDSNTVVQSVPDDRIAWHCGAKQYRHPEARNANSIGVELCDDRRDGTVYPTQATIDRALELVRRLMGKYGIPADRVIRHYDVSGKLCPAYWCGTAEKDALWRSAFWDRLTKEEETMETRYDTLDAIERAAPWALDTLKKLMDKGCIRGDGTALDLSRDMLRLLVICDRAGCYSESPSCLRT